MPTVSLLPTSDEAQYNNGQMKPVSFDSTPEFQNFTEQMRKLIAVPKARLDELVKESKASSPRRGNPHAPGRKPKARVRRKA